MIFLSCSDTMVDSCVLSDVSFGIKIFLCTNCVARRDEMRIQLYSMDGTRIFAQSDPFKVVTKYEHLHPDTPAKKRKQDSKQEEKQPEQPQTLFEPEPFPDNNSEVGLGGMDNALLELFGISVEPVPISLPTVTQRLL